MPDSSPIPSRRLPLALAGAAAAFFAILGTAALKSGVPALAVVLAGLAAGGVTAWSVFTDPRVRQQSAQGTDADGAAPRDQQP